MADRAGLFTKPYKRLKINSVMILTSGVGATQEFPDNSAQRPIFLCVYNIICHFRCGIFFHPLYNLKESLPF